MNHGAGFLRYDASAGDRLIGRARRLAFGSAARLRRAATRLAGDDGLALACAIVDMVMAGEPPAGWPIAAMIELLDTPAGRRDRQVERLLAELRMIETDLLARRIRRPPARHLHRRFRVHVGA
jgi:hypothetical protein